MKISKLRTKMYCLLDFHIHEVIYFIRNTKKLIASFQESDYYLETGVKFKWGIENRNGDTE